MNLHEHMKIYIFSAHSLYLGYVPINNNKKNSKFTSYCTLLFKSEAHTVGTYWECYQQVLQHIF